VPALSAGAGGRYGKEAEGLYNSIPVGFRCGICRKYCYGDIQDKAE
jgi:hypothetical protein